MRIFFAIFSLTISFQLVKAQLRQAHQGSDDLSGLFHWNNDADKPTGPEASLPGQVSPTCPKNGFFFGMNPLHRQAISRVKGFLMEQSSFQTWRDTAGHLRDHTEVNPHVWLRAVVSSMIHRQDIPDIGIPPIAEVIPSLFFPSEILEALNKSIGSNTKTKNDECVVLDGTIGMDNGEENLIWYFREDVLVNSHHWYWHMAYPLDEKEGDRRGELFYWMHHDMKVRFHSERLSVGLSPYNEFIIEPGARIPIGYNPHMHDGNSHKNWSARRVDVPVSDISSDAASPGLKFTISLKNWTVQYGRIRDGIIKGSLIDVHGKPIPLNTSVGIDQLGNTVEATAMSVNSEEYGLHGIHNEGHLILSLAMDPRNERATPPGVMGDVATAMRDPIFYSYHHFVDKIFEKYKDGLPSYKLTNGDWPLLLKGIKIQSFSVRSGRLPTNQLQTFWSNAKYDLSRGLDFGGDVKTPMWVCAKHLNHQDFQYDLNILRNTQHDAGSVTVRIFMGPRFDWKGRWHSLDQQRRLMFILDRFTVPLWVGENKISRDSTETPLTVSIRQGINSSPNKTNVGRFCGCGWPHHLLIPKGNSRGLPMDIFAIVTNSQQDTVEKLQGTGKDEPSCKASHIYCGLIGHKYPDARPMGYPFDRKLFPSDNDEGFVSADLDELIKQVPNSAVAKVNITHFDEFRTNLKAIG